MSLKYITPRGNKHYATSERDYNYHIKHVYDMNNITNYVIDKSNKMYQTKYDHYLSQNKLINTSILSSSSSSSSPLLNGIINRKNQLMIKQPILMKYDNNNNNNVTTTTTTTYNNSSNSSNSIYSTYSIPSKSHSIYNYNGHIVGNTNNELLEKTNTKHRHRQSPIVHVGNNNIHNTITTVITTTTTTTITNSSNNNSKNIRRLNDGIHLLKHIHYNNKSRKYSILRNQYLINNSYDDVINLSKFNDHHDHLSSVLHLQDTLSLNKYALPTYRTEDSYVKSIHFDSLHQQHCKHHHQHQHQHPHHRQETSRQEQQQQRHSLLFDKTDFTTSKSHVLNANSQLLNESINYKNELNELITDKLNVSSISSNSTITITTTITTNTSNTSLNTISNTYLSTSYNDKHTIKCIPKLVPPLIGINETNLNDIQNLQNDIFLNTITSTTYNTTHDEIDNNDNINQYKNQYETNDLLINTNCCHDTLQSNYWLPKVAMNSNRTKYDEILSTSWHLLTMKNWKSDQELKRKMGLLNKTTSNFGSGSSSSNGIGGIGIGKAGIGGGGGGVSGSGGFWFREKTTNIKPFFTGRRRIDNHQSQQSIHQYKQQSKGIKISTIVNHCPLINQYLPSNKSLHCQYESIPMEESEIFSLPEAKSKFSLDNTSSYNTNNKKNKYTKPITSQSHINTPDEVNKKTKPKIQTKNMNNHNITSKLTHSNEFDTFNKNENTSTISMITNDSNHHIQQNHSSLTINPITMITNHKDHSLPAPPPPSSSSSSSSVGTATTLSTTATTATITTTTTQHHTSNKPHHSDYENVTNQTDKLCNNYSIKKFHEKSIIIETSKINNSNENTKKLSDDIDSILLKSNEKMNIPMTPRTALDMYSKKLTSFEREEILNFSKIWYLGLSAQKIDGIQGSSNNHGYDDDNGGYLKITHDHIAYRFQTLETLGKGSFGRVIRAIDHKSGFPVAIKIIRNKKRFHQQAQVEVAILENLKKADHKNTHNIIHIRDHFTFRNHLCIVFDLLGSNLYDLLRKNDFRGFTIHSLKKITVKLLNCLCLLRKQGIIHCDLKPENILIGLNNSSELKVIDFGSSCFTNQKTYTYIQSRFYRAPEIILGISYGPPIDMWSLGCILPELYTGRPLFPGENENEQLACIMEVLGVPSELLLEKASRRRVFFDSKRTPRYLTNSRGRKRIPGSETIENLVKTVDSKFINLLNQCLTWDPDERLTPNEALNHEWILHENEHNKQNITFQTIEHTNSENKQKDTIA